MGPHFPHGDSSRVVPVQCDVRASDEARQWTHEEPAARSNRQAQHTTAPSSTGDESAVAPASPASSAATAPLDDSSFPFAIKMLVSNNVAGSIIGRSGQTISDLQTQSSTRIKLSQSGDYFPGTQDRVCLVQGQADNVKKAMSLLLSRLYALQHQHYMSVQQQERQQNPRATPEHMYGSLEGLQSFSFVVRILVPAPSCGMIIGKGGGNVKQMVEASGVSSVRLSPKEGADPNADASGTSAALASATAERIVTITGADLHCCTTCLFLILDGMTLHPDTCRYSNMTTSYSRVMSAAYDVASATGRSAGMSVQSQEPIPRGMAPSRLWDPNKAQPSHQEPAVDVLPSGSFDTQPVSPSIAYQRSTSGPSSLQPGFAHSPASPHQFRAHAPGPPPYSPMFGGPASFIPPSPEYHPSPIRPSMSRSHSNTSLPYGLSAMDAPRPPSVSASAPDLLALQFQESFRMSDPHRVVHPPPPPPSLYCGPQQQPGFTVQVAIPDSLIGSILGRGGRTLTELQAQSNTRIRISQRGEYVPGTRNRIVTIRGPTAQSVTMAQMLMNQCMVLPPTAISPPTAFAIQSVDRSSFEQHHQQQQHGYFPPPSPTSEPPESSSESPSDPHQSHHHHHSTS